MKLLSHRGRTSRTFRRASSPGTVWTRLSRTSFRLRFASATHSRSMCPSSSASKLSTRRSASRARDSLGRFKACSANSSSVVAIVINNTPTVRSPQAGDSLGCSASPPRQSFKKTLCVRQSDADSTSRSAAVPVEGDACKVHCKLPMRWGRPESNWPRGPVAWWQDRKSSLWRKISLMRLAGKPAIRASGLILMVDGLKEDNTLVTSPEKFNQGGRGPERPRPSANRLDQQGLSE
jgi:hypothetical protein